MPASPWSVKGVDADARAAAKLAARRAGLTLGAWLNQTIRGVAGMQLRQQGDVMPVAEAVRHFEAMPAPSVQTEARPPKAAASAAAPAINSADLRAIFDTLQELSQRMEAAETKTTGLVEPLLNQVKDLRQQVSETRVRPGITTAPFERALHRLAERLERLEGGSSPAEETMHRLREGRG